MMYKYYIPVYRAIEKTCELNDFHNASSIKFTFTNNSIIRINGHKAVIESISKVNHDIFFLYNGRLVTEERGNYYYYLHTDNMRISKMT